MAFTFESLPLLEIVGGFAQQDRRLSANESRKTAKFENLFSNLFSDSDKFKVIISFYTHIVKYYTNRGEDLTFFA